MEYNFRGSGRQKVFAPVGKCIYCGTDQGKLTEEHIIPLGLGGNMILPSASCTSCQKIINEEVEQRIQHAIYGTFGPIRLRLKLPTRKPKKRPKCLTLTISDRNGNTRKVEIPASQFPMAFIGMTTNLGVPGMLAGERPSNRFDGTLWLKYNDEEIRRYAKPGESVNGLGTFYPFQLARQIAKIAHALAAGYGLDSFAPFLPDIILGKLDTPFYYIGAQASPEPEPKGMHSVQMGWLPPDDRLLISYVRLFCNYGTPNYMVVVGERQR